MTDFKKAWQVATIFIGTIIGAGFATGKEIVEFFSQFGFTGFLAVLVAGFLFFFFGYRIMITSLRAGTSDLFSYNEWLFGKSFSKFFNVAIFFMLVAVTGVMIAGAGEVLYVQFGLDKWIGMVLTVILGFIVLLVGMKGLSVVNQIVVPVIIIFTIILAFLSISNGFTWETFLTVNDVEYPWTVILKPFCYVSFNLAFAQAVLIPMASKIKDEKAIKLGAKMAGGILTLLLILNHLAFTSYPGALESSIPTITIMQDLAPFLNMVYVFVIFGGIFTTVIGNAYGIERQVNAKEKWASWAVYLVLFAVTLFIAQFEYEPLLELLYPIFGYLCLIILARLVLKKEAQIK